MKKTRYLCFCLMFSALSFGFLGTNNIFAAWSPGQKSVENANKSDEDNIEIIDNKRSITRIEKVQADHKTANTNKSIQRQMSPKHKSTYQGLSSKDKNRVLLDNKEGKHPHDSISGILKEDSNKKAKLDVVKEKSPANHSIEKHQKDLGDNYIKENRVRSKEVHLSPAKKAMNKQKNHNREQNIYE